MCWGVLEFVCLFMWHSIVTIYSLAILAEFDDASSSEWVRPGHRDIDPRKQQEGRY